MLNKKNIAKTMAAATIFSAAAPMVTSFAAVIDTNQEQEIKEFKAEVLEKFNTKYTSNEALLEATNRATKIGQKVYQIKIGTIATGQANSDMAVVNSYSDFEAKFDKMFSALKPEQKILVEYNSGYYTTSAGTTTFNPAPIRILEDGTVVDFDEKKYVDSNTSTLGTNEVRLNADGTTNTIAGVNFEIKNGRLSDGSEYTKIQISDDTETGELRYVTVKAGDVVLNIDHPKFRVVDGYYVDANGKSIKKFNPTTTVTDINELISLGGIIDGYYEDVAAATTKTDDGTFAIVKDKAEIENVDYTVADLYEVSTGRLTKTGNELIKLIDKQVKDITDGQKLDTSYSETADTEHVDVVVNMKNGDKYILGADASTKDFYFFLNGAGTGSKLSASTLENAKNIEFTFKTKAKNASAATWKKVKTVTVTGVRNAGLEIVHDLIFNVLDNRTTAVLDIETEAGLNRYETAVEASRAWTSATNVVLVSGNNNALVDGLTATPLAAALNAPILLTDNNELTKVTIDRIKELQTKNVYVVGGAVSDEIVKELEILHGLNVVQIAGDNRYDTSLKVAEKMIELETAGKISGVLTSGKFDEVFVVGGRGEADALSASAVAGMKKAPILLTPAVELDRDVKNFLKSNINDTTVTTDVFIVGGEGSVKDEVQNAIVDMKLEVERLAGIGRQETNAAVIDRFATDTTLTGSTINTVIVAKSDNNGMVDALAAGSLGAKIGAHIVLASDDLKEAQEDALNKVDGKSTNANNITSKIQAGYGIAEAVAKFIKNL